MFVNAMVGFKAESTFTVMVSFIAGADGVVYMHKTFRETIYLPAIPIEIEQSFINLFKAIEFRIPREAWNSLDLTVRQRLQDTGLTQNKGKYYEVRPRIRILIEKLSVISR